MSCEQPLRKGDKGFVSNHYHWCPAKVIADGEVVLVRIIRGLWRGDVLRLGPSGHFSPDHEFVRR